MIIHLIMVFLFSKMVECVYEDFPHCAKVD